MSFPHTVQSPFEAPDGLCFHYLIRQMVPLVYNAQGEEVLTAVMKQLKNAFWFIELPLLEINLPIFHHEGRRPELRASAVVGRGCGGATPGKILKIYNQMVPSPAF